MDFSFYFTFKWITGLRDEERERERERERGREQEERTQVVRPAKLRHPSLISDPLSPILHHRPAKLWHKHPSSIPHHRPDKLWHKHPSPIPNHRPAKLRHKHPSPIPHLSPPSLITDPQTPKTHLSDCLASRSRRHHPRPILFSTHSKPISSPPLKTDLSFLIYLSFPQSLNLSLFDLWIFCCCCGGVGGGFLVVFCVVWWWVLCGADVWVVVDFLI